MSVAQFGDDLIWLGSVLGAAVLISALAVRIIRPLRLSAERTEKVHDAVLGFPAQVDKRTGTIIRDAEPGLVEQVRSISAALTATADTLRQLADSREDYGALQREIAKLSRDLETHIKQCDADRQMWAAIDAVARAAPPAERP